MFFTSFSKSSSSRRASCCTSSSENLLMSVSVSSRCSLSLAMLRLLTSGGCANQLGAQLCDLRGQYADTRTEGIHLPPAGERLTSCYWSYHNIKLLSHSPFSKPGPPGTHRMSADMAETPEPEGRCSTSTSEESCIISSISSITCTKEKLR